MIRQGIAVFVSLGIMALAACTRVISGTSTSTAPLQANNTQDSGASSGGGGYVTDNSRKLLDLVVTDLSKEITQASPFLFTDLPAGWTQQKLANVIRDIRLHSLKDVQRDNSDLLFNYGKDEKGPYIEALRPFFIVYGQIPMTFSSPTKNAYLKEIVLDLRLKVLHEVAHLLDKDEAQAREYGLTLLKKLERDFYICMVPREQLVSVPNILWVSPRGLSWWTKGGGGSSNCFGPRPDCEERYVDNWIHPNNWIFHQAKNQMLFSQNLTTYFSHLDPQPFEKLKERWDKDQEAPGASWEKSFGKGIQYPYHRELTGKFDENSQAIEYSAPSNGDEESSQSAIKISVRTKVDASGVTSFSSAWATVPVMKITLQAPDDLRTMYNNPVAPMGEYTKETKNFDLKCAYFGDLK